MFTMPIAQVNFLCFKMCHNCVNISFTHIYPLCKRCMCMVNDETITLPFRYEHSGWSSLIFTCTRIQIFAQPTY